MAKTINPEYVTYVVNTVNNTLGTLYKKGYIYDMSIEAECYPDGDKIDFALFINGNKVYDYCTSDYDTFDPSDLINLIKCEVFDMEDRLVDILHAHTFKQLFYINRLHQITHYRSCNINKYINL